MLKITEKGRLRFQTQAATGEKHLVASEGETKAYLQGMSIKNAEFRALWLAAECPPERITREFLINWGTENDPDNGLPPILREEDEPITNEVIDTLITEGYIKEEI